MFRNTFKNKNYPEISLNYRKTTKKFRATKFDAGQTDVSLKLKIDDGPTLTQLKNCFTACKLSWSCKQRFDRASV